MFLLIDNYDSFTFNLVQAFQEQGSAPRVVRHDEPGLPAMALDPDLQGAIISPGPGGPESSGLCLPFLRVLPITVPVLGVCLGHQVLGAFAGRSIQRAGQIMHGKTSLVNHKGTELFQDMSNPFQATRYHSLLVDESDSDPNGHQLWITARSENGELMGFCFTDRPWFGIQFHPESILTPEGPQLLANFLRICQEGIHIQRPGRALNQTQDRPHRAAGADRPDQTVQTELTDQTDFSRR